LHDGHYGNWVPNPIVRLTHLIDSMRDENGAFRSKVSTTMSARYPPLKKKFSRKFRMSKPISAANFRSRAPREMEHH